MKLLFTSLSLLLTASAFSQQLSDSAKALDEQVKIGNTQAILDAGGSGDKSLIPYLRSLDSRMKAPWAQVALAKLGDETAISNILDEFDEELSAKDWSPHRRGMEKLSMVGGKIAFRKFYQVLLQLKPLPKPVFDPIKKQRNLIADEYDFPMLSIYLLNLRKMVTNPPKLSSMAWNVWTDEIVMWKTWFANHKELIQ